MTLVPCFWWRGTTPFFRQTSRDLSHLTKTPNLHRLENSLLIKLHPSQPWLKYNACAVRFIFSRILETFYYLLGRFRKPQRAQRHAEKTTRLCASLRSIFFATIHLSRVKRCADTPNRSRAGRIRKSDYSLSLF